VTPDSRLYTFIDEAREFALYFLEGQRLIQDLALLHNIQRDGFAYFRDVVLSIQPLIALLKHGEQLGFYIDSDDPSFRLKIETSHHGETRCMLYPENFRQLSDTMCGLVRLQKLFPNHPPYESVIEVDGLPLREIVNRVLRDSYQVNCVMMLSQISDQSVLLHQLPPLRPDEYDYSIDATRARREQIRESLRGIFEKALHMHEDIEQAFSEIGFRRLADRPVRFHCSCSHERMVSNIHPLYQQEGDGLFDPGQAELEVTCEYCKSRYRVSRQELERTGNSIN